jgi:hypothetical protein
MRDSVACSDLWSAAGAGAWPVAGMEAGSPAGRMAMTDFGPRRQAETGELDDGRASGERTREKRHTVGGVVPHDGPGVDHLECIGSQAGQLSDLGAHIGDGGGQRREIERDLLSVPS